MAKNTNTVNTTNTQENKMELISSMAAALGINTSNKEKKMSNKCFKVEGCDHTNFFGQGSGEMWVIEQEAIMRGEVVACDKRREFVDSKVDNFRNYLLSVGAEADAIIDAYIKRAYGAEPGTEVSDMQVSISDDVKAKQTQYWADHTFEEAQNEEAFLERNAKRAERKFFGNEGMIKRRGEWLEATQERVAKLEQELKWFGMVQDLLDEAEAAKDDKGRFPRPVWNLLMGLRERLDEAKGAKEIGYETWVTFKNQIHAMIGWKLIQVKEDWLKHDLVDRISYNNNKIADLKRQLEELHYKAATEKPVWEMPEALLDSDE